MHHMYKCNPQWVIQFSLWFILLYMLDYFYNVISPPWNFEGFCANKSTAVFMDINSRNIVHVEIPDKSDATVPKWRNIWLSEDSTTLLMFLHLWCGKLFLMLVEILFLWCVSLNEFYAFILSYNIRYFL